MAQARPTATTNVIGILGGMGPASTAHFYATLVRLAQERYGAQQDHEFPPMVINSLPMTDWGTTGFTDIAAVQRQLVIGVQTLERAGSDFIVIPCNTVHHLYDAMQAAVGIPIVHLIAATLRRVRQQGLRWVGVLGTESTQRLEVYQRVAQALGIGLVDVSAKEQDTVTTVIGRVEAGSATARDTNQVRRVAARLVERGAQGIVLGCTELPVALRQRDTSFPLFDSSLILAETALAHAYGVLPLPLRPTVPVRAALMVPR